MHLLSPPTAVPHEVPAFLRGVLPFTLRYLRRRPWSFAALLGLVLGAAGAAGGDDGREHQRDVVADAAGRVLVHDRAVDARPVEDVAGIAHGERQRDGLLARQAVEEDRHGKGRDLSLGDALALEELGRPLAAVGHRHEAHFGVADDFAHALAEPLRRLLRAGCALERVGRNNYPGWARFRGGGWQGGIGAHGV